MRDSAPRSMPPEVQRAYVEPIDLLGLLYSKAYGAHHHDEVRDVLLSALLEKYGDVWVSVGRTEQPVSRAVSKMNAKSGIFLLVDVADYGGREETLPWLAKAMQPRWWRWWNAQSWWTEDDIFAWIGVSSWVLSRRQCSWLAAQYARTSVHETSGETRRACLRAIEAAEAFALAGSLESRQIAEIAAAAAARDASEAGRLLEDDLASSAAFAAASAGRAATNAAYAYEAAHYASDAVIASPSARSRLCELTKKLITPTLITSSV